MQKTQICNEIDFFAHGHAEMPFPNQMEDAHEMRCISRIILSLRSERGCGMCQRLRAIPTSLFPLAQIRFFGKKSGDAEEEERDFKTAAH